MNCLFRFVKEHYPTKWSFLLLYFLLRYERRIPIWSFVYNFLVRKKVDRKDLGELSKVNSTRTLADGEHYDVVIPTLGRKNHLYNYLKDLANQTIKPKRVIIVEQNPDRQSNSELDYLHSEQWPFDIKHHFIHQLGACNARNLALKDARSEWVVLGDDDIRVDSELYPTMIKQAIKYGIKSVIGHCPEPGRVNQFPVIGQTTIFGSGLAVVHRSLLDKVGFDLAYEFGYGEDSDFGMQIRNTGQDVVYLPGSEIQHLKVSEGGFRTEFEQPWSREKIQPKPAPTVMMNKLKYLTTYQLRLYKLILFMDVFKDAIKSKSIQSLKNFNHSWNVSKRWAEDLVNQSSQK